MIRQADCPDEQVLESLVLGQLPDGEAEAWAEHLEQCERCAATVHSFKAEDALTEAARAEGDPGEEPDDDVVRTLIDRLSGLPLFPTPPGSEEEADGPARGAEADAGLGADVEGLLAPAQGPGELGRLGPYRVLRVLGMGGMGVVFEAEDPLLKR